MLTTRTSRRTLIALGVALVALAGLWFGVRRPVELVALADPFLYNGPAAVGLPVRARDALGREVGVELAATAIRTGIAEVDGQRLRCLSAGDTEVRVRSGRLTTSFLLQCRPVAAFAPFQSLELVLGGPPQLLPVVAFDTLGQLVDALRFSAVSSDTSVVVVHGGYAVPRALGQVQVTVDVGGLATRMAVEVTEIVAREAVQLAGGEYRSWELGPGRYRAELVATGSERMRPAATWRSVNANCAYEPQSRATLHCVLEEPGRVVLLADASVSAAVRIHRRLR
ncbi:MAG: hypothetical protein KF709_12925 [Gemmatimonadaceae bacterium]|nr:hypothetical protein [Gemmatimonadaceae bacterium]